MNHIYTTKAIIVKSAPVGEANKLYFLLTHDLGFIKASAQGVRLSKSKLKGHLEEFSLILLSVVKGKEIWRITSVETIYQNTHIKSLEKLSIIKIFFLFFCDYFTAKKKMKHCLILSIHFMFFCLRMIFQENS